MYELSDLKDMLLPALHNVAKELGVPSYRKYKRKELIDKIIETQQAGNTNGGAAGSQKNEASATPAAGQPVPEKTADTADDESGDEGMDSAGRKRMRKRIQSKVYNSNTGREEAAAAAAAAEEKAKAEAEAEAETAKKAEAKEAEAPKAARQQEAPRVVARYEPREGRDRSDRNGEGREQAACTEVAYGP